MTGSADRARAELLDLIDRYGWAVRNVLSDEADPPLSYTVGLTALDHPEVVITGMPFASAQGFLNLIGQSVRDGKTFKANTWVEDLTDTGELLLIEARDVRGLTAVGQVYGRINALQLVWCDSTGRFPWQPGYRNGPTSQPILGPLPEGLT